LAGRSIYLCTPDRPDLVTFVAACIAGGVDVVQLRDKHLGDDTLVRRARELAGVCAGAGVPFIVNDRPDLAVESGADGVHLGQSDMDPAAARSVVGSDAIVGRSTHEPNQLLRAMTELVDYVSVGPVEATPTKPGRSATGLDYVRHAAMAARLPWFVTGGVDPTKIGELVAAGARRFVVVRWLTEASDPREAAHQLRVAIDEALVRP